MLVGVDTAPGAEPLTYACSDVKQLRALASAELVGEPLLDPTEQLVRDHLDALFDALKDSGGPLLLVWAGHGVVSAGQLLLRAANTMPRPSAGIAATEVMRACVDSGAGQLLLIFDTCYSGAAADSAGVAKQMLDQLPPNAEHVWVGVLASAQASEKARDGLFGRELRRLLSEGPSDPDLRRRWSVHNRELRGDDLCDALVKEWASDRQRLDFRSSGSGWWVLPNPLYRPDAPEQVVEHLLRAARGGAEDDERSWFTGRTGEVDQVVGWVTAARPGLFVVTGSPGTGKSAVVGRVVSVANPTERVRLLADDPDLGHADPGRSAITANVHARGLTADRIAELLDAQLVRAGRLPRYEPGERNAAELLGALQRAHNDTAAAGKGDEPPSPVLVVDGLDEAREQAFPIAAELLVKLAGLATVIVATRQLPPPPGSQAPLLGVLSPVETLNLDDEQWQDSGRQALREYVIRRLTGVDQRMTPDLVAALLAGDDDVEPRAAVS
ncbi:ATP-binding protein [Blastococcus sp. CT_GayMR19]|uniref:ATP-binding protein n=1 Tax=Blastococcus sp. CT_GayMR19 TaxID=2559608 RepID=UPI00142FBCAB|nr:ATP-binding protein [Blastococcus sp. CT_GayMR19]